MIDNAYANLTIAATVRTKIYGEVCRTGEDSVYKIHLDDWPVNVNIHVTQVALDGPIDACRDLSAQWNEGMVES